MYSIKNLQNRRLIEQSVFTHNADGEGVKNAGKPPVRAFVANLVCQPFIYPLLYTFYGKGRFNYVTFFNNDRFVVPSAFK